jgi:hypothetical protein
VLKRKKFILFVALTLFFCIDPVVVARDKIRIVGTPLVLHYFRKVAQNFALISEFSGTSLKVTRIIGNPTYGAVQRTKSMRI